MTTRFAIALALGGGLFGATEAAAADSNISATVANSDATVASSDVTAEQPDAARPPAAPPTDGVATTDQNDWDVAFTPYLWVAGTKGSIGIPKNEGEVNIDKSFAEILGNLNFAFMGALDVHHRRFVVLNDTIYLSVGMDAKSVHNPEFLTGHVDASTFLSSLAAGYRIVDNGPMFVDVFAGGRVVSLHAKVNLEGPIMDREASKTATTIAPLVGARIRVPIGRTWAFGLYGDVGGLVKGADVKWQVFANVQHDISKHWKVLAGYRYMGINHNTERFDFNIKLSGPLLGFTYQF